MHYVYILRSLKNGRLYKGLTEDLRRRFKQHNMGQELSTKAWAPWELLYYAAFKNKTDARREELFLKSGKGRGRLALLLKETLQ
jgi:putative endonuclease